MKKTVFLLTAALLWFSAWAETIAGSLKIYSEPVYATPFPAEPGKYFEIWLKIQNTGFTVNDAYCEILAKYPFSLDAGEVPEKQLGQIVREGYAYARYRIRVASDAVQGSNELSVRCRTDANPAWVNATLAIPVKTAQPTLNIQGFTIEPREVRPGNGMKATMSVKNNAPNALKDIVVKIDLTADAPLAPVGGGTERRVASLAPGGVAEVVFEAIVLPDAAPKIYRIPVKISYGDELGGAYSKEELLSVVVSDSPRITVGLESTTIIRSGSQGKVTLKIVNGGLAEAKFLRVTIPEANGFETLSPHEAYIGTLNSDDYETAEFALFVNQTEAKSILLPVEIEFVDALNREVSQTAAVHIRLYSEEEISAMGLEQKAGLSVFVVVVVVAVAAYLAYRGYQRFRKK